MQDFYIIFCFIKLKPASFYLWVNFLDLVYNNFNVSRNQINEDNNIQFALYLTVNTINSILLIIGIFTYFWYIYKWTFRTPLHRFYVIIRYCISFGRLAIFTLSLISLLILILKDSKEIVNEFGNACYLSFVLFFEIQNFLWCNDLKEVVYYKGSNQKLHLGDDIEDQISNDLITDQNESKEVQLKEN